MDYQVVEQIREIIESNRQLSIYIYWDGLPDAEDWTWEPLKQVFEDVPELIEEYRTTTKERALKKRALKSIKKA